MAQMRIYNMVEVENDICPEGELLTDKELEKLKQNNVRRNWPKTCKIKTYGEDVYFCFGARFTAILQEVLPK